MPRTRESTGRKRAIGTHFPMLAAAIAVAAEPWQLASRCASNRVCPADFQPERDAESARALVERRSETVTDADGNLGSPTLTHGSGRPTRSAGLGSGSTRTSTASRPLLMSRNSAGVAAAGKMSREWMEFAYLGLGNRKYDIPHHPLAHDVMMGVTDAQGLIAIVDARIERRATASRDSARWKVPRPTASGSCGSTWRDPHIRRRKAGSRGEATAVASRKRRLLRHGGLGRFDVPRSSYRVMGSVQAPETSMRPGNAPGLSHRESDRVGSTAGDNEATADPRGIETRLSAWYATIDILSRVCVRAKSEKIRISGQADRPAAGDRQVFPAVDDLKPLIQQELEKRIVVADEEPAEFGTEVRKSGWAGWRRGRSCRAGVATRGGRRPRNRR